MAFFIFVPFSCLFIYEVLNYFIKKDIFKPLVKPFTLILVPSFFFLGFYHLDKLYTGINFLMAGTMLLTHFVIFNKKHLGRFILAYVVSLIPFLFVNGILTGSWIEEPIVRYNDHENLSIRIGTIPVEDTVYAFTLLLMNLTIYEKSDPLKQFNLHKVNSLCST